MRLLRLTLLLGCCGLTLGAPTPERVNDDLKWTDDPSAWHQQISRILDHRFSTFAELRHFALSAKKAGASVLMLIQVPPLSTMPCSASRIVRLWCPENLAHRRRCSAPRAAPEAGITACSCVSTSMARIRSPTAALPNGSRCSRKSGLCV